MKFDELLMRWANFERHVDQFNFKIEFLNILNYL